MRKFLKSIGSFSIGPIVGAILSFITVPIITHFISPTEYGKTSMFLLAQSTISTVIYLGMDQAFVREFNGFKDKIQKLLLNAMIIPVSLSLFVGIILVVFDDHISNFLFGVVNEHIAVYALALAIPFMIFENFSLLKIRMEEKGLLYSFFTIFLKTIILILTILFFLVYENSFRSVVYATALGEIFTGILLYFVVLRKYNFEKELIDKDLQKQMLKFGLPLVPAFAVGWILTSMDKLMLRTMCNYEELGLYSAAFKIVSVLSVLQACFTLYWTPLAYRWYQEKKTVFRFEIVGKVVSILMTTVCMGVLLLKELVALILGYDFRNAIMIFPFLLLYPVLYTLSEITGLGIGFKRKTIYTLLVTSVSAIVNVALNWYLIPIFKGKGAAIATGISYVVFFWLRTIISRRLWYKFRINIYFVTNIIVIFNCAVHTFMQGYVPYLITLFTLLVMAVYLIIYFSKNNLTGRIKSGELFK